MNDTVEESTDGRRSSIVGQAASNGWNVFAGYKVRKNVTVGAWTGAPWKRWNDPQWGVRAEVRF